MDHLPFSIDFFGLKQERQPMQIMARFLVGWTLVLGVAGVGYGLTPMDRWHKLLHYEKGWFGYSSRVDDPNFFLHPKGKESPQEELDLTLAALREAGRVNEINCRFPARVRFLQKYFDPKIPIVDCPKVKEWESQLSSQYVSLLFASQYAGNPASRFGHTFLRFGKAPGKSGRPLSVADPVATYAADIGRDVNGFNYIYGGLFGGFKGTFTVVPFSTKLLEYSRYEDRNIWEYVLKITDEERDLLALHLYELKESWFVYWFTTENCSYQLLAAIEAVVPDADLVDQFDIYTLPVDTIIALQDEGRTTGKINFYPSIGATFAWYLDQLEGDAEEAFERIVTTNRVAGDEPAESLEAALYYFDFQVARDKTESPARQELRRKILQSRAKLPPGTKIPVIEPLKAPPHYASPLSLLEFGRFVVPTDAGYYLRFRPLVHSLEDSDVGLNTNEDLTFFEAIGELVDNQPDRPVLKEFTLLRNAVYRPWKSFQRDISWDISLGVKRTGLIDNDRRLFYHSDARLGLAYELGVVTTYGMGGVFHRVGTEGSRRVVWGPGFTLGAIISFDGGKIIGESQNWRNLSGFAKDQIMREHKLTIAYYLQRWLQLNLNYSRVEWPFVGVNDNASMGLALMF